MKTIGKIIITFIILIITLIPMTFAHVHGISESDTILVIIVRLLKIGFFIAGVVMLATSHAIDDKEKKRIYRTLGIIYMLLPLIITGVLPINPTIIAE